MPPRITPPDETPAHPARIAKLADIVNVNFSGEGGVQRKRRKHLHDVRSTLVTYLTTDTNLSDAEIAGIMA